MSTRLELRRTEISDLIIYQVHWIYFNIHAHERYYVHKTFSWSLKGININKCLHFQFLVKSESGLGGPHDNIYITNKIPSHIWQLKYIQRKVFKTSTFLFTWEWMRGVRTNKLSKHTDSHSSSKSDKGWRTKI